MDSVGIPVVSWVVGKALSPLSGGMLESWSWAASTKLRSNVETLKLELLQAQAILNNARGWDIHNPALAELLNKLRQLAYGADAVLDELDYFRIQDELDGTYHAVDVHASSCVQVLALNTHHTARACMNKLKFPLCTCATKCGNPDEQDDAGKQGCLSVRRFCGGLREINSSPPSPTNQLDAHNVHDGCMPKAACNVGTLEVHGQFESGA